MRLLPSVPREKGGESRRGVDMRGEIFTGEKWRARLDRGEKIKPGDFQIQNIYLNRWKLAL